MKKVILIILATLLIGCNEEECQKIAFKANVNKTQQKSSGKCNISPVRYYTSVSGLSLTEDLIKDASINIKTPKDVYLNGYTIEANGWLKFNNNRNNDQFVIHGPGTLIYLGDLTLYDCTLEGDITIIDLCDETLGIEDIIGNKQETFVDCDMILPAISDGYLYTKD